MVAVAVRGVEFVPERWLFHIEPGDEALGDMLIRLRKERGWSQYDVAREIVLPGEKVASLQTVVHRYEAEKVANPSDKMLNRFAALYGVPRRTIDYAAFQSKLRRERQLIPPDSLVVGPVSATLREAVETVGELEDREGELDEEERAEFRNDMRARWHAIKARRSRKPTPINPPTK